MPVLKIPNADMTPYDRLKMFIRRREERGNIPNTPKSPYKGIIKGPEASLWDDGLPKEPSLVEQAKQFLAAAVMDPNNFGMPGVGISYAGAKQDVMKLLKSAYRRGFTDVEEGLLKSDLVNQIHPDALRELTGIKDTNRNNYGAIDSYLYGHGSGNEWDRLYKPDNPYALLMPRGYLQGKAKPTMTFNLLNLQNDLKSGKIAKVVSHEVGHANAMYGKEVLMPAYDIVERNSPLAKRLVTDTHSSTGIGDLSYYRDDPQELVAELNARFHQNPNEIKKALLKIKEENEWIYNGGPDVSTLKLLDPVYYQSLLDFMKK